MNIIIDQKHIDKISQEIKQAEGRATARTITAQDIIDECDRILQRYYGLGASLESLEGTEIHININAQDFPNAYKYTPESTWFDAVYRGKKWRLTDVTRRTCTNYRGSVDLRETARDAIMMHLLDAGSPIKGKRDGNGRLYRAGM